MRGGVLHPDQKRVVERTASELGCEGKCLGPVFARHQLIDSLGQLLVQLIELRFARFAAIVNRSHRSASSQACHVVEACGDAPVR